MAPPYASKEPRLLKILIAALKTLSEDRVSWLADPWTCELLSSCCVKPLVQEFAVQPQKNTALLFSAEALSPVGVLSGWLVSAQQMSVLGVLKYFFSVCRYLFDKDVYDIKSICQGFYC